jgi:hypothetical protein
MTDASPGAAPAATAPAATAAASQVPPAEDPRPYSPGLEGVIAAETALGLVDGANDCQWGIRSVIAECGAQSPARSRSG